MDGTSNVIEISFSIDKWRKRIQSTSERRRKSKYKKEGTHGRRDIVLEMDTAIRVQIL